MKEADFFGGRFEATGALIEELARRARGLTGEDRTLFSEALEEIQITLEELQTVSEELLQNSEELAQARQAADDERQRYLGLFAFAPDAYIATDPDGIVTEANERAGTLFGLKPSRLVKKPLVVYVERKDRRAFYHQLSRLKGSDRLENWEIYLRTRTGRVFPGLVDVTTIRGRRGPVAGFRWLIRDASEAKKREQEARLATFPELNPLPVLEVDQAGHVFYLNRAARRAFRGLAEAGLAHPALAGIGELAERLRRSKKSSITREVPIGARWFREIVWRVSGGDRLRIYGQDITAWKRAEEESRKSQQQYQNLVTFANSIILRWTPDGKISYINPYGLSFFGYADEGLVGRDIGILIPAKDSAGQDLSRLASEIVRDPEGHAAHENENVLRDGRRAWVLWSNRAMYGDDGTIREILAIGNDVTAARQAEERLRETRDYLDNLIDHANAPIIVWDARSRITRFNRAFEAMTGRSAGEVLGRDIGILFPDDRRAASLDLIRRTIAGGERWEAVEIPILHRDGTVKTALWNSANILDPVGRKTVATIAQGQDITERKRIEEALLVNQAELEGRVAERTAELARSSELLERMFASVDLAIAYIDKGLNFIRVNKAFADAFGGGPDDYRGRNVFARGPDAAGEAKFRKVLETGEAWAEFESAFPSALFPGREKAYWDWNLQRVSPGGEAEGLILSLVDVSQRVKAEEERRRLATAVRQSTEGIVITDKADRIVFANQSFQTLHGLDRKDLLGRAYGDILLFDREADAFRDELRQVKERGEVWKARLTRTLGGRADTKLDITISPVRDPSGEIVNFAVLERDMTNEHRLEASVRQLQKFEALGTLAGGVAHDFNNILVPIFINAEMAAFDAEKGSPLSRYLNLILEAANRGRELIKQIIAFSRPSEPKRALVDIVPVVKEALQFLRSSIPRTVTIRERFGAASGLVRADPIQIHQIIMNLGSNAAYAMRDGGGELDLGLSEVVITPDQAAQSPDLHPGPYVRLTVADTGPGMTKEIAERIFDPFFTTKRRGEGAGMGLPVVLGIVRGHGGTITVATEPGRGTTFEVLIPKASGRVAPSRAAARLLPIGPGRVLFVDDEEMLVRTVAAMLERLGLTVTAASDPVEALEIFRKSPGEFDLVITDQAMPGLTGDKLAREMLRLRPDLPIILSTGFSETIREEEAQAIGIRDFVMKPFSTAEISDKIRAALKKA